MLFNRKGQMEVLGLTMVVILMAVGMLFVVSKMINRPVSEVKDSFLDQEVAANMLNSLLKTSAASDCRGADFTELFQDCASFFSVGGSIRCRPDNRLSCAYLVDKINNTILKNTTVRWKIPHRLTAWVVGKEDDRIIDLGLNCSIENDVGVPKWYPVPTNVGTLMIGFKICS